MKRNGKRLRTLEIRGFKSIPYQHPLVLEFSDINILLGANGAGKSNIVSFFKLLGFLLSGHLQRFIAEAGTNQRFLYYGAKKTPVLAASLLLSGGGESDRYSFSLAKAVPDRLILSSEEIERSIGETNVFEKNVLPSGYNESSLIHLADKQSRQLRDLLQGCKVYQFSDSSVSSPMRESCPINSAPYLQSGGENLAAFLYNLKHAFPEAYHRITEYVRDVVPQFSDFYLESHNDYISLKWIDDSANDYVLGADQFSDGSIRFIALAALLLQPEETMPFVMVIDEPELGLHPYAIDQLNEMIRDASRHAQIIVATQSTAIIDGFSPDEVTVIERDSTIKGTVARKLSEAEYHDWLEEYSLSELWNKNIIGGRPV